MKKRLLAFLIAGITVCSAVGCGINNESSVKENEPVAEDVSTDNETKTESKEDSVIIDDDYRTTYEIFVYSFCDSDGDGIGDLQGVINKLDYINDGDPKTDDDLGCTQIWLMPICPSTTYHKYDVTDYCNVDPEYGTIDDYKQLVEEAHKRGIRVINDTVINHSSSQHPWFKEAVDYLKKLPEDEEPNTQECPYVDYYHFSKEPKTGYEQVPGADWYYECQFWSEMPDLNLDNDAVQKEFADMAKFWLDLGCDGFRMDAVTQFTTDDIGASTEQLSKFVDAVKKIKPDTYIVGEAWTASGGYAKYYASGIDSLFDFDFSGSEGIISKCAKGKATPEKYVQAQIDEDELYASYNENYINAPFYTNHDMARSAGYYTGKKAKNSIKLAGALNLLMSGNAFIYYGEELGMKGSGKDENKRAPMQWDAEGAEGMTRGPADMDDIKMSNGTYKEQKDDPDSIFNYYKKAIHLRNDYPAIARGKCDILENLTGERNVVWVKDGTGKVPEGTKKAKILIALNNGDEAITIDLSKDEGANGYRNLAESLVTGQEDATLVGDMLTVPAFGIAILTEAE